jgi:hypothetical protein
MTFKSVILIFLFCPALLFAQEKLNSLKAPSSPAAAIMGIQAATVLTPKTYQALETALFSNFINSDGNTILPNDFSLEFTPYWAKDHKLSLNEYLFSTSDFRQLVRNSSFSVASTQNFLLGDSTATNGLSFGYRTTLFFGNQNDKGKINDYMHALGANQKIKSEISAKAEYLIFIDKITSNNEFLEKMREIVTDAIYKVGELKDMENAIKMTDKIYNEAALIKAIDKENPDVFLQDFYDIIDKMLNADAVFNEFETYIQERQGFSVDLAFASFISFPTNAFEYAIGPHQSLWITPTYRCNNKLSFLKCMGVLRYGWYDTDYYKKYFSQVDVYQHTIDYGLAVSAEFKSFSFQFELVGRNSSTEIQAGTDAEGHELYRKENTSDVQYLGSFNYNLTDQIVVSYSLGKRFEPIQNPNNTLISQLTLNFGFGAPTKDEIVMGK